MKSNRVRFFWFPLAVLIPGVLLITMISACETQGFQAGAKRSVEDTKTNPPRKTLDASSSGNSAHATGKLVLSGYAFCGDEDVVKLAAQFSNLAFAKSENLDNQVETVVSVFAVSTAGQQSNIAFLPDKVNMLAVAHGTLPISRGVVEKPGAKFPPSSVATTQKLVSHMDAVSGDNQPIADLLAKAVANLEKASSGAWKKSGEYAIFANISACLKTDLQSPSKPSFAKHEVARFMADELRKNIESLDPLDILAEKIYAVDPMLKKEVLGAVKILSDLASARPPTYKSGGSSGGLESILKLGISASKGDKKSFDEFQKSVGQIAASMKTGSCELNKIDSRASLELAKLGVVLNLGCRLIDGDASDFSTLTSDLRAENKIQIGNVLNRIYKAELYLQVLANIEDLPQYSCLPADATTKVPTTVQFPQRSGVSAASASGASSNYISKVLMSVMLPIKRTSDSVSVDAGSIKLLHPESNFAIGAISDYLSPTTGNLKTMYGMAVSGKYSDFAKLRKDANINLIPVNLPDLFAMRVLPASSAAIDVPFTVSGLDAENPSLPINIRMHDARCNTNTGGRGYCGLNFSSQKHQ